MGRWYQPHAASPHPACKDELAFYSSLGKIGHPADGSERSTIETAEAFFALAPHGIVFTHRDLNAHNIMVCGIFDWEAAA